MFRTRRTILVFGDILSLALAFFLMVWIRFDLHAQAPYIALQAKFFGLLFLLWLAVFFIFELYAVDRINPNPKNIGFVLLALLVNVLLTIPFFYFFPQPISPKTNLVIVAVIAFILLIGWRRLFYQLFTKTFPISIGIVGTSTLAAELAAELSSNPHVGIVRAAWETLPKHSDNRIDILIVEHASPEALVTTSRTFGTHILSLTQAYEMLLGKIPLELMTDERAVDIITVHNTPFRFLYQLLERCIAAVILALASPLLLLAAIAIMLEDGAPFFYSQLRVGKNGNPFSIYKLRSMKKDAERNGAQWAQKGDPRVTRVGRILRKTHIDEIPQMWNVIRGDLALIGPRAERPEIVADLEKEIPYYYLRHAHTPGFTGWAQIKFRYARTVIDSKEKFEYDLYYLCNRNPLLDFGIILKTIQIIFTH